MVSNEESAYLSALRLGSEVEVKRPVMESRDYDTGFRGESGEAPGAMTAASFFTDGNPSYCSIQSIQRRGNPV